MVYLVLFFFQRTCEELPSIYLEVFEMKKVFALVLALAMLLVSFCAVAEDGKLYMATEGTFPPYEYYEGSKIVGIDVEIAAAIAEKLGYDAGQVREARPHQRQRLYQRPASCLGCGKD